MSRCKYDNLIYLYYFQGKGNMSDYAISFHYMQPLDMYKMEYYVYQLKPYGIERQQNETVRKMDEKSLPWTREERMGNQSRLL